MESECHRVLRQNNLSIQNRGVITGSSSSPQRSPRLRRCSGRAGAWGRGGGPRALTPGVPCVCCSALPAPRDRLCLLTKGGR